MLDADGEGDLSLKEFVRGMAEVKGEATAKGMLIAKKKAALDLLDFQGLNGGGEAGEDAFEAPTARRQRSRRSNGLINGF